MGILKDYVSRLQAATIQKQEDALFRILKSNEAAVVDFNTGQLMEGINAIGQSVGDYRSEFYAEFKRTLNPRGVVDLNLHGDFHAGFFLEGEGFPAAINSTDLKTGKLTEHYENTFGLTEESQTNLNFDILLEQIQGYYSDLFSV